MKLRRIKGIGEGRIAAIVVGVGLRDDEIKVGTEVRHELARLGQWHLSHQDLAGRAARLRFVAKFESLLEQ